MKRIFTILIILICMASPVLADNVTNTTPENPLTLSFQGGHMFGENPVEILINQTPYNVAFIGNTSSKSINLSPDYGYIVRVEPSGISDAANAPDAGLVGIMKWMDKNPFGTFAYATLIGLILLVIKRR